MNQNSKPNIFLKNKANHINLIINSNTKTIQENGTNQDSIALKNKTTLHVNASSKPIKLLNHSLTE